jgi:spore coat protein A
MVEVDPATVTVADQGTDGIIQLIDKSGRAITLKRVAYREYDGTTIVIPKGDMEVWRFLNISGPPHPMHIHMCRFQVLGRQYFRVDGWNRPTRGTRKDQPLYYTSDATVEPHENGWKDVVRVAGHIVSPPMGEMVTVAAEFDTVGASVYHCHALEHEPHMIRPFVVLPTEIMHIMDEGHG